MSGVTDKRIDRELKKLDAKLCTLYSSSFRTPADGGFWQAIDQAEGVLADRLRPRPLGALEIRQACSAYTVAFRRACDAGRQRAGNATQAHRQDAGRTPGSLPVQGA